MLRTTVLRGTLSSKAEGIQGELVYNEILRISFACFILKRAQAQNFKSTESEEARASYFSVSRYARRREGGLAARCKSGALQEQRVAAQSYTNSLQERRVARATLIFLPLLASRLGATLTFSAARKSSQSYTNFFRCSQVVSELH